MGGLPYLRVNMLDCGTFCANIRLLILNLFKFHRKMVSKIYQLLNPKLTGQKGKDKPIALIVNSPYDESDASTKFSNKKGQLIKAGFGLMNKGPISFDASTDNTSKILKFSSQLGKNITLFFNAHGAPGFLFARYRNAKSELEGLYSFAKFVRQVEEKTGKKINNIILSGCYNAVEIYNPDTGNYFNSPARLLSLVFPEKNIVGFQGQYADAVVTHIYDKNKSGEYISKVMPAHKAGVLFNNGKVIERPSERFYCKHDYTQNFIIDALDLDINNNEYFKPILFKEGIDENKNWVNKYKNLGKWQEKIIPKIINKLKIDFTEDKENINKMTK